MRTVPGQKCPIFCLCASPHLLHARIEVPDLQWRWKLQFSEQGGNQEKLDGWWNASPLGECANETGASAMNSAIITSIIRRMFARPGRVNLHNNHVRVKSFVDVECVYATCSGAVFSCAVPY